MSNTAYRRIPSSELAEPSPEHEEELDIDPRFIVETPPWWQRAALIGFIVVFSWIGWMIVPVGRTKVPLDWEGSLWGH